MYVGNIAGNSKKAPPRDYSISGVGIDRVFGVFNAISIIATTYGNGIIPEIQVQSSSCNNIVFNLYINL